MFADTAKITVFAGRGGKGCESFQPRPGKKRLLSGGDGGQGGSVILKATPTMATLLDFRYKQHFRATSGHGGGSNRKKGKTGPDLVLEVPLGTTVIDADSQYKLRDLKASGESVIVAKGGHGGKGNAGGKTATEGEPGETRDLILELRLIADGGIVGLPNVGKSTLLSKLTGAHSKIAEYPFTTKTPHLGVLSHPAKNRTVVLADIPGLIEGAHQGKGLGDQFLRHIERTSFLLHMMDMSGEEGRDPLKDYDVIRQELYSYGHGLSKKPELLVGNKMDRPQAAENLRRFQEKIKTPVLPLSLVKGEGVDMLILEIFRFSEKVGIA